MKRRGIAWRFQTWWAVAVGLVLTSTRITAATATGVLIGWGDGFSEPGMPLVSSNFLAISSAQAFTLGLTAEGKVVGWGTGLQDQLHIPESLTGVRAISAGYYFGLALPNNGRPVV